MGSYNQDTINKLQIVGLAVLESIEQAGDLGAPAGILFAAMQAHGASLNQFQSIMRGLTEAGKVCMEGECYHLTQSGRQFIEILQHKFSTPAQGGSHAAQCTHHH